MKTFGRVLNGLQKSCLALAVLGLLGQPTATRAQKGAEQLMRLKPAAAEKSLQTYASADRAAPGCPKCTDTWVTVVEKTFKAVQPEIRRQVLHHECATCSNVIVTEGHGKAKTTRMIHVCKEADLRNTSCCGTAKDVRPAPDQD